jgi:hypothetical protein
MIIFEIVGLIFVWFVIIFVLLWFIYLLVKTDKDSELKPYEMPKLQPLPIPTKNQSDIMRILVWLYAVRKWQVLENWIWQMDKNKEEYIVIPKDFIFNGPSIPRLFWFILSPVGLLLIPGLIHDYGYRHDCLWQIKNGELTDEMKDKDQKHWDLLFKDVGEEVNGVSIVDWIAWKALVHFGKGAWKENRAKGLPMERPYLTNEEKKQYNITAT